MKRWLCTAGGILFSAAVCGCVFLPEQEPSSFRTETLPMPAAEADIAFPRDKYSTEPTVAVWLADRGTIEYMPLETYLEGVVAKEMLPDFPYEAMAAQAICARTLALSAIEAGTIKQLHGADVSTSKDELQAYDRTKITDKVRRAVKSTRGEVILYQDKLINCIYSACNGQVGATKEESFPTEIKEETPYFQTTEDHCFDYAPEEYKAWEVAVPKAEVAAAVGYTGDPANIRILSRGPSGRILRIGTDEVNVYGSDFRRAIGYERLMSTLVYEMNYDGEDFIFTGSGWGNGVGLCQWGAYAYAKEGLTAKEILAKYYIGTMIQKIYE